jgi:hypothetical protein
MPSLDDAIWVLAVCIVGVLVIGYIIAKGNV